MYPNEEFEISKPAGVMSQQTEPKLTRKLLAEFIGDVIFVFIGSLSGYPNAGGLVAVAFGHGLTIAVLIMAFGHISGGHFNPAVTLGVLLSGNMEIASACCYWAVQLVGGFLGALLVRCVTSQEMYDLIGGGATIVDTSNISWWQAVICEILLTYILVNSVLLTAVDTDSNLLAPLAIGISIVIDIFAGGKVSGASMNPARSLGPCIAATLFSTTLKSSDIWTVHYVYWLGPTIGAAIAALLYKLVFGKDERRMLF